MENATKAQFGSQSYLQIIFKLDNMIIIVDRNNFQQTGKNSSIMDLKSLKNKFKSFEVKLLKLMVIILKKYIMH